jgi:hypothetical protein
MKRRTAVKSLSLAVAGLITLPGWANGWNAATLGQASSLPKSEEMLLAEIVETIIPETETPGAKSLQVHQFVLRMIQDCYGEPAQVILKDGLITIDQVANGAFTKNFTDLDATQRTAVLAHLQASAEPATKQFIGMVKNLTIQGYLNSEYVLVNIMEYKMAPGFYHGCVPIKT